MFRRLRCRAGASLAVLAAWRRAPHACAKRAPQACGRAFITAAPRCHWPRPRCHWEGHAPLTGRVLCSTSSTCARGRRGSGSGLGRVRRSAAKGARITAKQHLPLWQAAPRTYLGVVRHRAVARDHDIADAVQLAGWRRGGRRLLALHAPAHTALYSRCAGHRCLILGPTGPPTPRPECSSPLAPPRWVARVT